MLIRLHAFEVASRANGPGLRAVVWFQGCPLKCPGCFNPETHDPRGGSEADTVELAAELLRNPHAIEGVSFSGGEPFQQPEGLLGLLERLAGSGLSTLVFSGYNLGEIERQALGPRLLERIDVLIAGRYVQAQHLGSGLLGSANQKIHLLSRRYKLKDFATIPRQEIILHRDGSITLTGITSSGLGLRCG
jgi:anaerobic ribonucleoside-triphosphate reductase activating protein